MGDDTEWDSHSKTCGEGCIGYSHCQAHHATDCPLHVKNYSKEGGAGALAFAVPSRFFESAYYDHEVVRMSARCARQYVMKYSVRPHIPQGEIVRSQIIICSLRIGLEPCLNSVAASHTLR
jgi:hypothetical protein